MTTPPIEHLRAALPFFDLKPLFLVVAGEHMHGFPVPDPVVRVAGCHRTALEAALGKGSVRNRVEVELSVAGMDVRVRSEDRHRVVERIRALDAEFLEALHSPLVITGEEELRRLRDASSGYLTLDLGRHYLERAREARACLERRLSVRVTDVLFLFRALLTGIHVLSTGRLQVDLGSLVREYDLAFLKELVRRPDRPPLLGDPARTGFLLTESEELFARLERAIVESALPGQPLRPGRLAAWLEESNRLSD